MTVTAQIIRKVVSLLMSGILALSIFIMDVNETDKPENFAEPVSTQAFGLLDELFRGQGITTDGEHFYFSYNVGIMKTELDATTVIKQRILSIPIELLVKGCDHIGGISYYDGKLYASLEDSKARQNLYLLCYEAETLALLRYVRLDPADYVRGVPWVTVDRDTGIVYAGGCENFDHLNAYNPITLEYLYSLDIDAHLKKIQGGDVYKGVFYCASSRDGQKVYAINLSTGEVQTVLERNLYGNSEGEDITVLPMDDGSFFHAMDIGDIRIGGHLRHYAFNPDSIVWKK